MPTPLLPRILPALLACALALGVTPALAQETESSSYVEAKRFTRADGLPSDYILALHRDQYGFLWVGTDVGLARYDGARFEAYGTGEGLPHSFVNRIEEDGEGTLWVATYEGLARLRRSALGRGHFEAVPMPHPQRGDASTYALGRDERGRLVVATGDHVGVLLGFSDPDDPKTPRWSTTRAGNVQFSSPDLVTLVGGRILSRRDATSLALAAPRPGQPDSLQVRAVPTPRHWGPDPSVIALQRDYGAPPPSDFYVTSLAVPIAERSRYLYRCRLAEAESSATAPSLVVLDSLDVGHIGLLWAHVDGRLYAGQLHAAASTFSFTAFQRTDDGYRAVWEDLSRSTALLGDDEGSIWLGSFGRGMRQFRPSALTRLAAEPTERVAARLDASGEIARDAPIYAATQRGITRVEPRTLRAEPVFPRFGTNRQRGVAVAPDGRVALTWAVNLSVPVRPDGLAWPVPLYAHRYTGWYADVDVRGDTLTAASYGGGVMRFLAPSGGAESDIVRLDTLTLSRGLPTAMTERLVRLPSGLYVLTRSHGAWRLPPVGSQRAEPLVATKPVGAVPSQAAYSLHEDASGAVWIGTDRGVVRVLGDSLAVFGEDVLRGHRVTSVFERPATPGLIWLTGDRYLYHLDPASGAVRRYGTLPLVLDASATINDVRYHAATDRLFLATTRNFLAADLARLTNAVPPAPPLALTALRLDDADAVPEGSPLDAALTASAPGARRVEVEFAPLSLAQSVEAEYRLGDAPWRSLGAERRVVFSDLPPGAHTLVVRAVAPGQAVGEAALLRLTLPPHWWQRGAVRVAFFAALALLLVGITRALATRPYREKLRALELEQELRGERERISRDLHDHVGAQVTHMIAEIEEARLASAPPESTLRRLDAEARSTLAQLRETIWALKQEALTPHALGARIERFAGRQCHSSGLACEVRVEGDDVLLAQPLPPVHSLHLYRIAQEALTNAAKYSGGTRIVVTLRRAPGSVSLTITDDGTFRPPAPASGDGAATSGGFGLAHIRERAEALGGAFALETEGGTTVCVTVPLEVVAAHHRASKLRT